LNSSVRDLSESRLGRLSNDRDSPPPRGGRGGRGGDSHFNADRPPRGGGESRSFESRPRRDSDRSRTEEFKEPTPGIRQSGPLVKPNTLLYIIIN